MKKLILLAGVAALASCGDTATEEAAPAEVVEDGMMEPAAEEESMAGTYEVTWPDGTTSTTVINEDGTWTGTGADGTEVSGTYAMNDAGQTCFMQEGEEARCWTDGETNEDGSINSTDDAGTAITYRRVDDA